MSAPRAFAFSSSSSTSTAPPSACTKPLRRASKGIDAASGESYSVASARAAAKPANEMGVITASAPPASITSASPRWMAWNASPMAWLLLAHADTGE
jgi:hypothetical protein